MKMSIKILKYLLWPFSLAYGGIIIVRNWLYDNGFFKVFESKITTINIGNLTAGGTGKTPHVEYLIKLLNQTHQLATLSRGYGRKTTGFVQANINSDADEIGDESLQIFWKFGKSNLTVSVGEDTDRGKNTDQGEMGSSLTVSVGEDTDRGKNTDQGETESSLTVSVSEDTDRGKNTNQGETESSLTVSVSEDTDRGEGKNIEVFMCEKRATGLQKIEISNPAINLIILDDAFQHRAIKPKINILITDYNRLFTNDLMLPTGLLREPKSGAKRADAIIVSKCSKNILESEKENIRQQIYQYSKPNCPVFFSTFQYEFPQPYFQNQPKFDVKKLTILLSGIAQPQHFEAAARHQFNIDSHLIFKDHHSFSEQDLPKTDYQILTTEKDLVKIKSLLNSEQINFYFWPIEVHFLEGNTQSFDDWLATQIGSIHT